MSERYPPPAYACTVWTDGNVVWVAFPGQHNINFPLSPKGVDAFAAVLMNRYTAEKRGEPMTIGHKAAPVQYDMEKILTAMKSHEDKLAEKAQKVREAREFLQEIGLGDL